MKRKIFLALTTVLSAVFLASCSCDSCAGNTKVSFKDYYLQDADHAAGNEFNETITYSVTHTGNNTYNNYSVQYSNGTYQTNLKKVSDEKGDTYILFTSTFSINVSYTYNGETSELFTDTSTSAVTFRDAKNMLTPVSSTKTVYSHSPAQSANALKDCYVEYHQTVTTTYNSDCTAGSSNIINHLKADEKTSYDFEIEDTDKYAYLDNEQLLFALRCMNPNTTGKVQVYSPFANSVQTISTAFGSSNSTDFKNLTINGKTHESLQISYLPVTMEIDVKNNGTTQTAWIAETKNTNNNTYRNVMLKYIVPLPFTLGELHYNLVSADFIN